MEAESSAYSAYRDCSHHANQDSIANLITNKDVPSCAGATRTAYTKGLQFALTHLREVAPSVTLYLNAHGICAKAPARLLMTPTWVQDAGHGGWLGWDDKARELLALVCKLKLASSLRGFSTNVANYNPLGKLQTRAPPSRDTPGSQSLLGRLLVP
eukprot:5318935-Pleurochrysis_carterae.AAC.1